MPLFFFLALLYTIKHQPVSVSRMLAFQLITSTYGLRMLWDSPGPKEKALRYLY